MSWQIVIGMILIAPIAILIVAGWVKWTRHAWKVRTNRSIVDEFGTGRDHWIIWLILHGAVAALVGTSLLLPALEGRQQ